MALTQKTLDEIKRRKKATNKRSETEVATVTERTGSNVAKSYDMLRRAVLSTTNKSVKERTGSGNKAGASYSTFTASKDYINRNKNNVNTGVSALIKAAEDSVALNDLFVC